MFPARDIRASLHIKTPYREGITDVVFEPLELMTHLRVRHPSGDLRSSKSAILPICYSRLAALGNRGQTTFSPAALNPPLAVPLCLGSPAV